MFCREPGYESVRDKIIDAEDARISIPSVLELQLVLRNRNYVDALLTEFGIKQLLIDSNTLDWVRYAAETYERGTVSPAKLNIGDSFSYTAAKATGEPLLFVGDDFTHIDIQAA